MIYVGLFPARQTSVDPECNVRRRHHLHAQVYSDAIKRAAAAVECSEAVDWQFVQVTFDSADAGFDEDNRISPYLLLSADLEFPAQIQVEFHDGEDYAGGELSRIDLWRHRVRALSGDGYEFDIAFELSDDAFAELRKYLKVLTRSDCFRE